MALRVQDFRSRMEMDGARPSLFQISLTFPAGVQGNSASEKLSFMARASQLPGSTIQPISTFYQGRELKLAGNRTFPEWTFTIINDEDFEIRKAFEVWMGRINSHVGNLRSPNFIKGDGGYQVDGFVTQLDKTDNPIKEYSMVGAWPTNLDPIPLDWGAVNQIEEFSVTMAYQWWTSATDGQVDDLL